MDGDQSEALIIVLILLFVVFGITTLILGTAILLACIAIAFGLGVISNLFLRLLPNLFDWNSIDEDWIWCVIVVLGIRPFALGYMCTLLFPTISIIINLPILVSGLLMIVVYISWLAGYLWSWFDPRFEMGSADVVMASEIALLITGLEMLWTYIKLELDLFASDLGLK